MQENEQKSTLPTWKKILWLIITPLIYIGICTITVAILIQVLFVSLKILVTVLEFVIGTIWVIFVLLSVLQENERKEIVSGWQKSCMAIMTPVIFLKSLIFPMNSLAGLCSKEFLRILSYFDIGWIILIVLAVNYFRSHERPTLKLKRTLIVLTWLVIVVSASAWASLGIMNALSSVH